MKKISLIINVVLIIAVGLLYYFQFTGPKTSVPKDDSKKSSSKTSDTSFAIAYVNIDTLMLYYNMYEDMKNELGGKQKTSEAELNSKSKSFEKKYTDFQNKVQKGLVTRYQAAEMEQELLKQQQDLVKLRDDLSMRLMDEEQVMNRKLLYSITEYLEEFNKEKNYKYIFSNAFGGNILFADNALDITQEVVDGMNAKYLAEQEENKAK